MAATPTSVGTRHYGAPSRDTGRPRACAGRGVLPVGWITHSKSGRSFYYQGRRLEKIKGGYKYNCIDPESGERFWVSGPHRDGHDRLYGGLVEIDADTQRAYWIEIRKKPEHRNLTRYRS